MNAKFSKNPFKINGRRRGGEINGGS